MPSDLDHSSGIDPLLIEEQIRFMLANNISAHAVSVATKIPRCPALRHARGSEWAKNNVVINAILRIEMVQRGGKSAEVGRREKYLRFRYNGGIYVPPWQFTKTRKIHPLVKTLVELYQKGSSDPEGSPPINEAWSNFYVVCRAEEAVREYETCRIPAARNECRKQLIQRTKRKISPSGW